MDLHPIGINRFQQDLSNPSLSLGFQGCYRYCATLDAVPGMAMVC